MPAPAAGQPIQVGLDAPARRSVSSRRRAAGTSTWGHLTVAAAFGNVVPFLLLSYGEQTTGAGLAGVLVGSTPLLTLALAAVALHTERPTPRKAVGLLVGFVGGVLVVGPWRDSSGSLAGQVACLGAALSYAVGFVYVRRFLPPRGLAPLALAAAQLATAAVLQVLVTRSSPGRRPS